MTDIRLGVHPVQGIVLGLHIAEHNHFIEFRDLRPERASVIAVRMRQGFRTFYIF